VDYSTLNFLIVIKKRAMTYLETREKLKEKPSYWLITGVAGFIGSNLLETLLKLNQNVTGLDNFSTGYPQNLDEVRERVDEDAWKRFRFVDGDIRDKNLCQRLTRGMDYVLHQAAMGSVPRSIEDPVQAEEINSLGFLNVMHAAKEARVKRVVFASSSAVYGDDLVSPKVEESIGNPLSPYAVTKRANELYAQTFSTVYKTAATGLRYFNIFGERQDPNGAYAAVIPRWVSLCIANEPCVIYGDGETSRDFCHVKNVVQANILAAVNSKKGCQIYNVGMGESLSLKQLYELIRETTVETTNRESEKKLVFRSARKGDIRHSIADMSLVVKDLNYVPAVSLRSGMKTYIESEWQKHKARQVAEKLNNRIYPYKEHISPPFSIKELYPHSVQQN